MTEIKRGVERENETAVEREEGERDKKREKERERERERRGRKGGRVGTPFEMTKWGLIQFNGIAGAMFWACSAPLSCLPRPRPN